MPYAIEMFFDKNSEANIRRIWRYLKESGINSYMDDSGSVPHITLSVFNKIDIADIAFYVDNVEEVLVKLIQNGGRKLGELVRKEIDGIGILTAVYAEDPEGNFIEIQN